MPICGTKPNTNLVLTLITLALVILTPVGQSQNWSDKSCLKCHADKKIKTMPDSYRRAMVRVSKDFGTKPREPGYVDRLFLPEGIRGVHKGITCASCHIGIKTIPHRQYLPLARGCNACHAKEVSEFSMGSHAVKRMEGQPLAPDCAACHGRAHNQVDSKNPKSRTHRLNIPNTCGGCHTDDKNPALKRNTGAQTVKSYYDSIHGQGLSKAGLTSVAICTDCHGTHKILPEENPDSLVHAKRIPHTCGRCHQGLVGKFENSIHNRILSGNQFGAPHCGTCHSSHQIRSTSDRGGYALDMVQKCGKCHPKQLKSYRMSYHGKVTKLGGSGVALCSDCHGHHTILPASDRSSMIHKARLADTCRKCHPQAADDFALYHPHADHRDAENYPIVHWAWLIMTLILGSTLAAFIIHTLLWFFRETVHHVRHRSVVKEKHSPGHGRQIRRYSRWHRLTHLFVITSFLGLVATGLPIKYSYTEWARAMMEMIGGYQIAGFLHRACAAMTLVYVVMHGLWLAIYYLKVRRRTMFRSLFGPNSMMLRWQDVKDLFNHLRWFFFLGPRPKFDRWTYWDKADYWGEYWGITIIGATGLLLWFPDFFSSFLPGWIFNVALVVHSIEALLAACIIFLVHFFNVHLRPAKFPLDTVIFTGSMPEEEFIEEHPIEYERLKEMGELEELVEEPRSKSFRVFVYIFGVTAFLFGLFLVALIIKTEWQYLIT